MEQKSFGQIQASRPTLGSSFGRYDFDASYYRSYITQEFGDYLFDLDKLRICRKIQTLEPILANLLHISFFVSFSPYNSCGFIRDISAYAISLLS